jgi:hypothetical protein
MKKFVGLLLCLSLSLLIVARAAKPSHALLSQKEINSEESYAKSESFDMSDAEQEEVASADDDSVQNASDDEGEEMNDEPGDAGDEATGDDDAGDDGGGDEGE